MSIWNYIMILKMLRVYQSALLIHIKCGSIHKRALVPFLGPGSESQTESRWQVLPRYFVLRMHVPAPFSKEGLSWKCPHVEPRKNG